MEIYEYVPRKILLVNQEKFPSPLDKGKFPSSPCQGKFPFEHTHVTQEDLFCKKSHKAMRTYIFYAMQVGIVYSLCPPQI